MTSAMTGAPILAQRLKEVIRKAELSYPMMGAVLFGSVATGKATTQSDVDLLVIGEMLPPKRHRRHREMMEIKHLLPGVPLDVLLLTPEEVRSNFVNHNPLFLDIAVDGIILLDREGMLSAAMEDARRHIRSKGIVRLEGGWRFPVERGVPTYLSQISNRGFAEAMLQDAERDRLIGVRLLEDRFYDKSVYHFQQAVEKAVKAVLISLGIFQKTHLVGEVLRSVAQEERVPTSWRTRLLEAADLSESIEPEVSLSRYPGVIEDTLWLPAAEYAVEDAEEAKAKAEKVLPIARGFVEDWFTHPGSEGSGIAQP